LVPARSDHGRRVVGPGVDDRRITKTIIEGRGYPANYQYVAFGIGMVVEVGLVNLVVPLDHRRRPEDRRRLQHGVLSYSTSQSVNV
jgi:hypothetical protein